jgi:hypothetical protein
MRKAACLGALIAMMTLAEIVPITAAPSDAYAATNNARATALADCNRQARAMQFGKRAVQRRNFVKDCMIDRGFPAQTN